MGMRKVSFEIVGQGAILFGKPVHATRGDDETHDQVEERTWRERCTVDSDGNVAINAVSVQRSLVAAGAWLSMKLSGQKTFTKRFQAGVMLVKPFFTLQVDGKTITKDETLKTHVRINGFIRPEQVDGHWIYCPSDGKPGGTKRVWRCFPRVIGWSCQPEFVITDDAISQDIFIKHAQTGGLHDGMGSMRIGKGGPNGMYLCKDFQFENYDI